MSPPEASVRLDGRRRQYEPGELLAGEFRIAASELDQIKAVELSVIWCTEGKGDEDVGLHYFKRYAPDGEPLNLHTTTRFVTAQRLPPAPLSYEGLILKIRWCVRLRLFLPHGETLVHDEPFQLGLVPRARLPEPAVVGSVS